MRSKESSPLARPAPTPLMFPLLAALPVFVTVDDRSPTAESAVFLTFPTVLFARFPTLFVASPTVFVAPAPALLTRFVTGAVRPPETWSRVPVKKRISA